MSLEQEIVLLRTDGTSRFGTAFVVYEDSFAYYLLTCAHVVTNDEGEPYQNLRADEQPATVLVTGLSQGIDLALVRAERPPAEAQPKRCFALRAMGQRGLPILIVGFEKFRSNYNYLGRPIESELGHTITIRSPGLPPVRAWDVDVVANRELERGYSGSPAIDPESGCVLGVTSDREGGRRGIVIAIEHVRFFWPRHFPDPFRLGPSSLHQSLQAVVDLEQLDHLAKEASQHFDRAALVAGETLTIAAVGGYFLRQGEVHKARPLLQHALKVLSDSNPWRASLHRWLDQAQTACQKLPAPFPSPSPQTLQALHQERLNLQIYLTNRGWRTLPRWSPPDEMEAIADPLSD